MIVTHSLTLRKSSRQVSSDYVRTRGVHRQHFQQEAPATSSSPSAASSNPRYDLVLSPTSLSLFFSDRSSSGRRGPYSPAPCSSFEFLQVVVVLVNSLSISFSAGSYNLSPSPFESRLHKSPVRDYLGQTSCKLITLLNFDCSYCRVPLWTSVFRATCRSGRTADANHGTTRRHKVRRTSILPLHRNQEPPKENQGPP